MIPKNFQILTLFLYILCSNIIAQTDINIVKAAYIDKFLLFTQFPPAGNEDKILIGILGDNVLFNTLSNYYSKSKNNKKNIEVKFLSNLRDLNKFRVVYISNTEKHRLKSILNSLKELPILTIGDNEGFAQDGVMINFYIFEKKLRFEINEQAAKNSGLFFSYHLLQYAKLVKSN